MTPTRRGTPDFLLLFLTFLLVCFGLAFVFSAGMAYKANDPGYLAIRQGIAIAVGTVAMFFCMNIDYRKFQKWVVPFMTVTVVLLLAVPVIGKGVNGAKSWIAMPGGFSLQPTELAKLAVIIYLASIISKKGDRFKEFKRGLLPPLAVVAFICALIMLQNDLGSTMILAATAAVVIIVGGANLKHIFYLFSAGAALLSIFIALYLVIKGAGGSYKIARITSYLNPWADPDGSGFQLVQSLYAFGHGGFTGAGFGQSIQKLHYLPEAHNDFIFSIIGEELGFVGSALFLLVYLAFIWRGLIVALRCKELFGTLTGVGIVALIAIQAFINIGGVTASIPMTGVTLPLISYGGSSIIVTLISIGFLLSISREYNKIEKETKKRA
ncbi:putative lipid II flippase FtsW [Paenibacillus filicis]|uniref:Probable peptidoglycan glycosyltransferase FtsW n=1 Tax=Paenibacillus gyeongsangnamensis TaxID=3388067 RepID=A0ABT4Q3I6_9BACL|nr:putative lipid II flippase FtsW [Paenibacillus filicis]MCZ8511396.1 putative lipid II flippase FtsW [Paenibacillus filicis]